MITIFKNKNDIPKDTEYVELNDVYFNKYTASDMNLEQATSIIKQVDGSKLIGRYNIESKFNGATLNIDCLSTGCKTVLNILTYPDKVFCMKECGDNALEILYSLDEGMVYSDYATIPLPMGLESLKVKTATDGKVIVDYEKLKEWWEHEG
jgi:hypothetical protein